MEKYEYSCGKHNANWSSDVEFDSCLKCLKGEPAQSSMSLISIKQHFDGLYQDVLIYGSAVARIDNSDSDKFTITRVDPVSCNSLVTIKDEDMLALKEFVEAEDLVTFYNIKAAQRTIKNMLSYFQNWDDDDEVTKPSGLVPQINNGNGTFGINGMDPNFKFGVKPWTGSINTPIPYCNHEWKVYNGLNESFEYCKYCDIKKGEK